MSYLNHMQTLVLRQPVESGQYASEAYRTALAAYGMLASMSSKGDCSDNAVAERRWSLSW